MEVVVAGLAGFCFGVRRAVDFLSELLDSKKENEAVYTLGSLIHNPSVVADFESRGARVITEDDLDSVYSEACREHPVHVVIRTHGAEKGIYEKVLGFSRHNSYFTVHDLTCPYVSKIQKIAREKTDIDTRLIVYGNAEHPEVKGILSYTHGPYTVIADADALKTLEIKEKNTIVVAQTTKKMSEWKKIELFSKRYCTNVKIFDTICSVTENRQKEAQKLASGVDVMVVVGGRDSSNTKSLYEAVRSVLPSTYMVEFPEQIDILSFEGHSRAGITAGASTPRYIIEEVKRKMSEIEVVNEKNEENFAELLESSLKTLDTGDIVTGVITSITPTEIYVDLSTKGTGVLSVDELSVDPETGKPAFKVGDEIEVYVYRVSDTEGVVGLSRRKIERMSEWKKIVEAYKSGEVLEGKVTDAVKGGLSVAYGSSRIFIPASHTGVPKDGDYSHLVGTRQQFTIIDVDERRNHAVGSIRNVLRAKRKAAAEAIWDSIEVGKQYEGTVKSLTSYGAFIDLGGVDGMVHVSELSWSRISNPSEVVSEGDKLTVYVKSFDREKKRISLGYKTEETNPWNIFMSRYSVGDVATVKIVGITPFGAFAEIVPDVDGLIHISQIADKKIGNPADYLSIDQQVQVKIVGIDEEKKKVSLSIRALLSPDAEDGESQDVAEAADEEADVTEAGN